MFKGIAILAGKLLKEGAKNASKNVAKETTKNVTRQTFTSESRNAAFRNAKEINNIPRTEQPIKVNKDHLNRRKT